MAVSNGKTDTIKFMQVFSRSVYRQLEREAHKRGIGVQELCRAVIVPTWLWDRVDNNLLDARNLKALVDYHIEQERTYRKLAKVYPKQIVLHSVPVPRKR
jgi:hypothetical protein